MCLKETKIGGLVNHMARLAFIVIVIIMVFLVLFVFSSLGIQRKNCESYRILALSSHFCVSHIFSTK